MVRTDVSAKMHKAISVIHEAYDTEPIKGSNFLSTRFEGFDFDYIT